MPATGQLSGVTQLEMTSLLFTPYHKTCSRLGAVSVACAVFTVCDHAAEYLRAYSYHMLTIKGFDLASLLNQYIAY